ncbi:MAG: helix-turn-helix domain-containing protein [Treponema sp.]|nr:helix-turn-helix domain-containing protein [Treponema sp.]
MDVKSVFGSNLKHYRKARKLSQEELSEETGISVKHLSSIERGLTFVSADLLEKLAAYFGIPVFRFFVDRQEIFFNVSMLGTLDGIVETHLTAAIEKIKTEIRQNQS